jgi:hypothetical protein
MEQSTRPNDPVARVNIARVWRMLGDPEHALRILQATPILHVPDEYTCCTWGGSTRRAAARVRGKCRPRRATVHRWKGPTGRCRSGDAESRRTR